MTSNYVLLISAFKMPFRMTFSMTFRMTFNARVGGGLQRGLQRGLLTGYGRGLAVKLRSGKVQVRKGPSQVWSRSGPGLVQVWFSLQAKFNSFELDSEVGR